MKIIKASRYDELKKAREEYDAETARMSGVIEEQERNFRSIQRDAIAEVERKVSQLIGPTSLELEIHADPWGRSLGAHSWQINVRAHEHDKFNDNVALSWNWEIGTDDSGNIIKDSGSWSGLKATTPEQLADLEESVRIIKALNTADWGEILASPNPEYSEHIDRELSNQIRDRKKARPEFENDIVDARLEELVGADVAVQIDRDEYFNGPGGIIITGMSDKFVKGWVFPWRFTNETGTVSLQQAKNYNYNEERRIKKDKITRREGLPVEVPVVE